ncbi:MAG: hypothetical protein ACI90M_003054, partial [Candidatus Azotimanducaceae bacterium]
MRPESLVAENVANLFAAAVGSDLNSSAEGLTLRASSTDVS